MHHVCVPQNGGFWPHATGEAKFFETPHKLASIRTDIGSDICLPRGFWVLCCLLFLLKGSP